MSLVTVEFCISRAKLKAVDILNISVYKNHSSVNRNVFRFVASGWWKSCHFIVSLRGGGGV